MQTEIEQKQASVVHEIPPFTTWEGIDLERSSFEDMIEVFVGTSSPAAGDDAQTVLVLHDLGHDHERFETVRALAARDDGSMALGVVLVLNGDAEATALADALEFAAQTIRRQMKANCATEA